jgi:hypothetical protein
VRRNPRFRSTARSKLAQKRESLSCARVAAVLSKAHFSSKWANKRGDNPDYGVYS